MAEAHNFAHALRASAKGGVPQEAANVFGGFVFPDIEED
jgi:hypothetical protein